MNIKKSIKILLVIILLGIVALPIIGYYAWRNQFTGGNEYLRYEGIALDLAKNPSDTYSIIHKKINLLAGKIDFQKHEFILPNDDKPVNTRFYRQEDLKDGVINVRHINTEHSKMLNIDVSWVEDDYGRFYREIAVFIANQDYDFSVPYTQIGNKNVSRITKDKVLRDDFE